MLVIASQETEKRRKECKKLEEDARHVQSKKTDSCPSRQETEDILCLSEKKVTSCFPSLFSPEGFP